MDIELLITIGLEVLGFAVGYGVMKQKLDDCVKQIEDLEEKQKATESFVQSIDNRLGSIETKIDLLLNGKIVIKDGQ